MLKKYGFILLSFSLFILVFAQLASANPTLTITILSNKTRYNPEDAVIINGTVVADGSPVSNAAVAIEIDNATSTEPYLIRSRSTSGSSAINWPVEIREVFLSDQYGSPKSSVKQGDVAYFRVKVRNNEEVAHYVTLIPYFQMGSVPFPIEICPAFQGPIAQGMAYNQAFGKSTVGTLSGQIGGDKKFASLFELGISTSYHANVTKISWRGFSEQVVHAKAVIYSSNATDGTPLALVGTSQEKTLLAITQWWNFTFSPAVVLTGGYYWLGIISEPTTLHFTYDPAFVPDHNASAFAYNNDLYSDGPSNPFGTPTYENRSMDIFATYTLIQDCGIDTIFARPIPDNAPNGTATIFISAFREAYPNCLPINGGTVYSPDKAANFTITKAGSGYSETPSPNGYYELRFNPAMGSFAIYVSCYYQGQIATNSSTFAKTFIGDINGDLKVDGKDIAIVSKAYNTRPGDPLWDPRADVNGDLKVDGKDIAIVSKYYGAYM